MLDGKAGVRFSISWAWGFWFAGGAARPNPTTHTQMCEEAAGAMDPARDRESPLLGKEASWKGSLTGIKLSCIYYESNSNISEKTKAKEIVRGSAVATVVGSEKHEQAEERGEFGENGTVEWETLVKRHDFYLGPGPGNVPPGGSPSINWLLVSLIRWCRLV